MLPNLKNEGPLGNFGRYLSLAALLPISTFIGYAIGYGLDHFFGTHFLRIVFLLFGIASGFIELIREVQKDDPSREKHDPGKT
ncbi:MAG TPA: AtpZ/AtpI family protein [Bryobacteraceae bacterium]|nr:AtpZ/AtpI family protein [Bryobacteraceae bacterium]